MDRAMYSQDCDSLDIREMLNQYNKEELKSMIMELSHADHAIYQVIYNKLSTDTKWCKLFVHGLALNSTKQSLTRAFQQFGPVKEAIVLLEQHDRSKGCGFVIFETSLSARQALSMSVTVDGRVVQVDYAFKGNPRKFVNRPVITPEQRLEADGRRLFIHDLAWKTTNETLRQSFLQYGEIQEAVVIPDRKTGKSKGFGFVTFLTPEAAQRALREPVKRIDDRNAKVAYAKPTKDAEVPPTPYRSPSPTDGSVGSMGSHPSTNKSICSAPLPHILKRPSLDLNNFSNCSNASIGSIGSMTSCSTAMTLPAYSNANSAPPSMPMFTPSSVSNAWTLNGYPALPYISVSNQSSPSQQGTPQGTPVATPVLTNTSSVQTPPFISMQQIQQSVPMQSVSVVHPSMLPPPPSPHSLGIRSSSLSSSNGQLQGQEFKGGVALVNMQSVLQNAFVMQQSQ